MAFIVDTNIQEKVFKVKPNCIISRMVRDELRRRQVKDFGCESIESYPDESCIKKLMVLDVKKVLGKTEVLHEPKRGKRKKKPIQDIITDNIKRADKAEDLETAKKYLESAWKSMQELSHTNIGLFGNIEKRANIDCSLVSLAQLRDSKLVTQDRNLVKVCSDLVGKDKCMTLDRV
jgi:predicted nucleic acid-binding protein